MTLPPWSNLRPGIDCPLCAPRRTIGPGFHFVQLSTSSLYLAKKQTYRGACTISYDRGHATRPSELGSVDWSQFCNDIRTAEGAISALFQPDHANVEFLGNTVPHLRAAITPRYRSDPRWGRPIWTTEQDEMPQLPATDLECEEWAIALRAKLSGAT